MLTSLLMTLLLSAQGEQGAAKKEAGSPFELTMEGTRVVQALAGKAPLSLVARRISETLKVPVQVSPDLSKTVVSFGALKQASLTELLLQVTPAAYLDTRESWGADPELVSIVLGGALSALSADDEPAPAGMLVEGHTDEELVGETDTQPDSPEKRPSPSPTPTPTPEDPEGPFLRVWKEAGGRISVRAREQSLGTVLFQIAQTYGVRFDMRVSEAAIIPDLSISAALPSDLPGILGAGVGLLVRRNATTGEERPLRLFLDPVD
jgi:hypothetical protein